jgi:hypothetical protein
MQLPLNQGIQLSLVHSHGMGRRPVLAFEFHPNPVAAVPGQLRIANRIAVRQEKLEFVWHLDTFLDDQLRSAIRHVPHRAVNDRGIIHRYDLGCLKNPLARGIAFFFFGHFKPSHAENCND